MRRVVASIVGCLGLSLLCGGTTAHAAPPVEPCATRADVLGLSRIVEVDTAGGPLFGRSVSGGYEFLVDGEVVLTFDDGPVRSHTRAVLKALADHCTKATFFMVGRMAVADPAMVREVARQGHTVGSHTWSHAKLSGLAEDKMKEEIEMGFSAVGQALEGPIAPFFRFPYLRVTHEAGAYLKSRDVASFTIDIDSRDFRTRDAATVEKTVMSQLAGRRKGIILFHDIQPSTAKALPDILTALKERGFKVVHLVPKDDAVTLPEFDSRAAKLIARKLAAAKQPLADRAVTWTQSGTETTTEAGGSGEREVLPWAKRPASHQSSAAEATNQPATVPWYKKLLTP
jgi:peptidoglycan/xylan/chitin deacetylase (PgdA/CDA1 family)